MTALPNKDINIMTSKERDGRTCKNCDNFYKIQSNYGECRLSPPVFVTYIETVEERGPVFAHPDVSGDHFCGQFKPNIDDAKPF